MLDRKSLQNRTSMEDIRPARGVKIKQKEIPKKEVVQNKPQVIQNVHAPENVNPPTEDALRILEQSTKIKENLLAKIKDFNDLLRARVLSENKTEEDKRKEQEVVGNLARAAMEVDEYSPKEGLLSLCILSIRQSLSLRDAGNELAYKIMKMEAKIKELEEKLNNTEKKEITPNKEVLPSKKEMLDISNLLRKLAGDGNEQG